MNRLVPTVIAIVAFCICVPPTDAESETGGKSPSVRVEPYGAVPANHLKFYLHFSSPMERGDVFRHLRLVEIESSGKEIAEVVEPFREVELWDETFQRLTLWLHPGRQKPGVNLNVELGPILEPGRYYRLEISLSWRDERGNPLKETHTHDFKTLEADQQCPDPQNWLITLPDVLVNGSVMEAITMKDPPVSDRPRRIVTVHTHEPLDPVSARSSVSVNYQGQPVTISVASLSNALNPKRPGENGLILFITLKKDSKGIHHSWPPGDYELVIDPKLEDLAGNSIARPFNLDLEEHPNFKERTEPVILPFTIPETETAP